MPDLSPWYYRWSSCHYENGSLASYLFCQHRDGTVYVYRELLLDGLTAREAGAKLVSATLAELENQQSIICWCPPSLFEVNLAAKSVSLELAEGIASISGNVFVWQFTDAERHMPEDRRWDSLNRRRKAVKGNHLTIQAVQNKDREGIIEYVRALRSPKPLHDVEEIEFNRDTAIRLRDSNMDEFRLYMKRVEGPPAVLESKLLISQECVGVWNALTSMTQGEEKIPLCLEAFLCGMSAHRGTQNRQPREQYIAEHLGRLGELDPMARNMAVKKACVDYAKGSRVAAIQRIPRIVRAKDRRRVG